jgi:hypothetical protein
MPVARCDSRALTLLPGIGCRASRIWMPSSITAVLERLRPCGESRRPCRSASPHLTRVTRSSLSVPRPRCPIRVQHCDSALRSLCFSRRAGVGRSDRSPGPGLLGVPQRVGVGHTSRDVGNSLTPTRRLIHEWVRRTLTLGNRAHKVTRRRGDYRFRKCIASVGASREQRAVVQARKRGVCPAREETTSEG